MGRENFSPSKRNLKLLLMNVIPVLSKTNIPYN
jgi:hypothetical protein